MLPEREPPRGGGPRGGGQKIRLAAESTPAYQTVGQEPGTLFGEPVLAHVRSSATSRLAAEIVAPSTGTTRAKVIDCLRTPGTDDDLPERTGLSLNTARARRVEAVKAGLVVRVGTGRSAAGNAASLWQTTEAVASSQGSGAASTWDAAVRNRPSWMSPKQHRALIAQAVEAHPRNLKAALEQVARDLEALR